MQPAKFTTRITKSRSGPSWGGLGLLIASFLVFAVSHVQAQQHLGPLCSVVRQKCSLTCSATRARQLATQCGCVPGTSSGSSSSFASSSSGGSSSQGGASSGSSAAAEPALLTVGLECVTKNIDNTRTAYFSYNNLTSAPLTIVTNSSLGTVNAFNADDTTVVDQPPTTFKAGLSKGTVVVRFSKGLLTWVVKGVGMRRTEVTASDQSPECPRVVPIAECRGYESGLFKVRLGYENAASFEQVISLGKANQFSPGAADRGQPNRFFTGLNRAVFSVILDGPQDSVTWNINSEKVVLDKSIPACTGMCIDAPLASIKGDLDQVAIDLSALMNRAAAVLVNVKDKQNVKDAKEVKAAKTTRARDRRDAKRSGKKAAEYERVARALTIQFPAVVKLCPESPQFCSTVDRQGTIDALRGLYANQRNSVVRTMARVMFRSTGATSRRQKIVRDARALEQKGLGQLRNLPRFATECK